MPFPSLPAAEIPLLEGLLFGAEASYYEVRYLILVTVQTVVGQVLGRQKEVPRMRQDQGHRPLWVAEGAAWGQGAWVPCGARKREVGGWHFRVPLGSVLYAHRVPNDEGRKVGCPTPQSSAFHCPPPAPNSMVGFQCPTELQIRISVHF